MPGNLDRFAEQKAPPYSTGQKLAYLLLMIAGTVWIVFGAMNFFTHIGLIVHTMS